MNLFALIISCVFLIGVGLAVLVGIMHGRKYKWQISLVRIISVVISAIAAAFIASTISGLAISSLLTSVIEAGTLGNLGDMLASLPNGIAAISVLGSMIVAPIIFIPLFLVLKIVIGAIGKMIAKKLLEDMAKKGKLGEPKKAKPVVRKHVKKKNAAIVANHAKYLGAALGAVCSVLVLLIFLIPIVGDLQVVGGVAPMIIGSDEENPSMAIISDALDGVSNNAATFAVKYTGGKLLFGVMTTGELDGERVNLNKEGDFFASLANAVAKKEGKTPEQKAEGIRAISAAFSETVISRTLVSELCTAAGEDWMAGEAYYGMSRPSLGKNFKSLSLAMVEVLSTSDKENVKHDIKAITYAIAAIVERDLAKDIDSNPDVIISNEEATSDVFSAFLEDERHVPIVDALADYGVSMLMDSVKAPAIREVLYIDFVEAFISVHGIDYETLVSGYKSVFDAYAIRASEGTIHLAASAYFTGADMTEWVANNIAATPEEFAQKTQIVSKDMLADGSATITDREKEADALAHAFALSYNMSQEIKGDKFVAKNMLAKMGPALDSFAQTQMIGRENTGIMLKAILQSELVHGQIGFTVIEAIDTAQSIQDNTADKSYASVMTSLSGVIDMLEAASDANKNTKEAVDRMLANLTPEAATVMQTMATPSVMKKYGVPERSSASSAQMLKTTFANLKETPSDQYAGESAAVADMMNIMMSITENVEDARPTFGEGSSTQVSENQYVENIMSSSAMSQTVVQTVYGDGAFPTTDPLNSQKKLSDEEKANLLSSLNTKWKDSDKSNDTKKEIVAIASLMNLSVEVTDSGVTEVVLPEPAPEQSPEPTPEQSPEPTPEPGPATDPTPDQLDQN